MVNIHIEDLGFLVIMTKLRELGSEVCVPVSMGGGIEE